VGRFARRGPPAARGPAPGAAPSDGTAGGRVTTLQLGAPRHARRARPPTAAQRGAAPAGRVARRAGRAAPQNARACPRPPPTLHRLQAHRPTRGAAATGPQRRSGGRRVGSGRRRQWRARARVRARRAGGRGRAAAPRRAPAGARARARDVLVHRLHGGVCGLPARCDPLLAHRGGRRAARAAAPRARPPLARAPPPVAARVPAADVGRGR
jgi:hypothetical protein